MLLPKIIYENSPLKPAGDSLLFVANNEITDNDSARKAENLKILSRAEEELLARQTKLIGILLENDSRIHAHTCCALNPVEKPVCGFPIVITKTEVKDLLTVYESVDNTRYSTALEPQIRDNKISLLCAFYINGVWRPIKAMNEEQLAVYRKQQKLLLSGEHIRSITDNIINRRFTALKNALSDPGPAASDETLQRYLISHGMMQQELAKRITQYVSQLIHDRPKMPLSIAYALAIDALRLDWYKQGGFLLRAIEVISSFSDALFMNMPTAELLKGINNDLVGNQPIIFCSQYFTLEDVIEITRYMSKHYAKKDYALLSREEPDHIDLHDKILEHLRSDDPREYAGHLRIGYYIANSLEIHALTCEKLLIMPEERYQISDTIQYTRGTVIYNPDPVLINKMNNYQVVKMDSTDMLDVSTKKVDFLIQILGLKNWVDGLIMRTLYVRDKATILKSVLKDEGYLTEDTDAMESLIRQCRLMVWQKAILVQKQSVISSEFVGAYFFEIFLRAVSRMIDSIKDIAPLHDKY
ncbi:MAG: hypothetical protein ABIH39_04905 [Candidatus Margulisiibacteriota bacterium]